MRILLLLVQSPGHRSCQTPSRVLFVPSHSAAARRKSLAQRQGLYLCGAPELVCEVAASSASVDPHDKFRAYRRNGISEYLVWLTLENRVRWFQLVDQDYVEQKEKSGRLTSSIFPGLVLDVKALLKGDKAKLVATLRMAMEQR